VTKSILQDWVSELGLRQQGVLLTAVRGCDTAAKEGISKKLVRAFRAEILNAHVGDPKKSSTFIEPFEEEEIEEMAVEFCRDLDPYPLHYVLHLAHAAEVLGYYHPQMDTAAAWRTLYLTVCRKFHMNPETKEQLDARLNADEATFKRSQE
jgi:hypothetical protein